MDLMKCMKCSGSRLQMDIVGGRNRNHEGRQWIVRSFVRSLVTQFVVRSSVVVTAAATVVVVVVVDFRSGDQMILSGGKEGPWRGLRCVVRRGGL